MTVNSPLKQATAKDHPFSIPDSPPTRAASFNNHTSCAADDLDVRSTKSESPELTSVLELPLDDIAAITERESASRIPKHYDNRATPVQLLQLNDDRASNSEPVKVIHYQTDTVYPVPDKVSVVALPFCTVNVSHVRSF